MTITSNDTTVSLTGGELRQRMIDDMGVRGFTPKTQHDYLKIVREFAVFIGRSPGSATAEDLRLYQVRKRNDGLAGPAMNSRVAALRFFFTTTLDRPDLSRRLIRTDYPRTVPQVLSREEAVRLIAAAGKIRDRAILAIAYGAGLRVAEAARLRVTDIDSQRMLIRVERGKGRRDRNAILSADLLALLRSWWRAGKEAGVMLPGGWLFPGQNPINPITTRQINRVVKETTRAAGIRKRVSPHTLRHSFATHLLEDGIDIRVIQALLGHVKLDNTAFYTKVSTRTVKAVVSPFDHVAARLNEKAAPPG